MERRIRLRRSDDFRLVQQEGRSWPHRLLILAARPNDLARTRVGVTASRRIGGAVARNRARRLLREAMRQLYGEISSGWDLVLVARRPLSSATEPQVREALAELIGRAGLHGAAGEAR